MLVLLAMILCICKCVCAWGTVCEWHFCNATACESNCEFISDPSEQQFPHNSPQKRNITTRFPFWVCRSREKAMQAVYHSTLEETQTSSAPILSDLTTTLGFWLVSFPDYFSHTEWRNSLVNCLFHFCSKCHGGGGTQITLLFMSDM